MQNGKILTIRLSNNELELLSRLKKERHTTNNSQVIREAIHAFMSFFCNNYCNSDNRRASNDNSNAI